MSPPLVSILSQMHSVHTLPHYFPKIRSNIFLPSTPGSSEWSLPLKFSAHNFARISLFSHACYMPSRCNYICIRVRGCIQKFLDWPPGATMQVVGLSATKCSCIAILWVSLVRFAAITLYVTSQRVFIVVSVRFVTDSVRKLLDTPRICLCVWILYRGLTGIIRS
jgi:hypothetical protein